MKNITADSLIRSSLIDKKTSEKIVGDLLKISTAELFLKRKSLTLSPALIKNYKKIENKIRGGLPPQYAFGGADFYGLRFYVDKNVLIPRPETEIMVEGAIKYIESEIKNNESWKKKREIHAIDIGTGSGCIAITLKKELKHVIHNSSFIIQLFATDISSKALKIAKKNAKTHGVKIKFFKSDLMQNKKLPKKFGLILANLPYLPSNYLKVYSKEFAKPLLAEPHLALDGGEKGVDLIKQLVNDLPNRLTGEGVAILEIDPAQKNSISRQCDKLKLKVTFLRDLNRFWRFALIKNIYS